MATYYKNNTSEISKNKTAVIVLSLIPGFGLLLSLTVFICTETQFGKNLATFSKCLCKAVKVFQYIWKFVFKLNLEEDNIISIAVQPKIESNGQYVLRTS